MIWPLAGKRAAILVAALLASNTAFSSECTPPPQLQAKLHAHPSAENYATLGQYFGDKDRHQCAVQAWASALKLQPGSAKFAYMLGLNLYFSADADHAASALQQSIQFDASELQPHLLLATVLEQLHRGPEAFAEWRAALAIDPSSKLALDGMAKSLLASRDYLAVVKMLRSTTLDENLALDLALAYEHMGRLDDASTTLRQALVKTPSSLQLANTLAFIDLKAERHDEAAALLAKQYALRPNDLETQIDYFRILVVNDQRDKAQPLGKTLLTKAPHDFNVLYLNGVLEREDGDYASAKDHLEAAVQLNPNHADCLYNLGVALARLHQPDEARDRLEKAISLGWNGPEIRYELANVYRALGDTEKVTQQMTLYQQETRAKEQRTVAFSKAAQADQEMHSGDLKSAVLHYREASDAVPKNPLFAYKLATALDASNDPAQAEQQFRRAVQMDPNFTAAWIGLASTLAKESKIAEAKDAVNTALRLDPDNAEAQALAKQVDE
jgi:Flp pilus assembly protein TadD